MSVKLVNVSQDKKPLIKDNNLSFMEQCEAIAAQTRKHMAHTSKDTIRHYRELVLKDIADPSRLLAAIGRAMANDESKIIYASTYVTGGEKVCVNTQSITHDEFYELFGIESDPGSLISGLQKIVGSKATVYHSGGYLKHGGNWYEVKISWGFGHGLFCVIV